MVLILFLGISWFSSSASCDQESEETTDQQQINWLLYSTPIVIVLAVTCLSSMEKRKKSHLTRLIAMPMHFHLDQ
ncbi:hypothetical protein AKJ16_DCAP01489, partial [Drosera capensis]